MTTKAYWFDGTNEHELQISSLGTDGQEFGSGVVEIMKSGYSSVSNMLAKDKFYWAHRGCGYSWAEMSLQAYTVAVYKGFGALEVSLQRTSDGVFIGCHDPSINSVVYGGGTFPNVNEMTWAEIQQQMIKPADPFPHRPPQPFMRVEELFDAYASSHVIFVDPKNSGQANYEQLLDIMDQYGGPARFVGKYSGVGLNNWNIRCHERGYITWGYFYQEDYENGNLALWADQWDLLGINYTASQEAFDQILSFGKPVAAHIVNTPEQLAIAESKGVFSATISNSDQFEFTPEPDRSTEPLPVKGELLQFPVTNDLVSRTASRGLEAL